MANLSYDDWGLVSASDETQLFYGIRGQGPALVFLDGIGCDGWAWKHIQPRLAERYRTIHCHYRGHGRSGSPVNGQQIRIEDLRDDVIAVMNHLGLEQAALVAHSMGTQVALEVYRAWGQRIRGMALICGTDGKVTHTFHGNDMLHRVLPRLIEYVRRHRPIALALWRRLPAELSYRVARVIGEVDGPALDPNDFKEYVQHLSDIDLGLYLDMLECAGAHTATDLLKRIDVPTLVVAAERDTFTPQQVVKAMADAIPEAIYVELVGASHAAPAEQPQRLVEAVCQFLSKAGYSRDCTCV